jgi:hypothetical protein
MFQRTLCLDHVSVSMFGPCISYVVYQFLCSMFICSMYLLCCVDDLLYVQFMEHFLCFMYQLLCISLTYTGSGNLVHTGLHGEIYHTGTCVSVISKESPWRNISYRFQKFSSCISSVISLLCKFLEFLQCCEILINIYRFLQLCFCNVVQNIQVPAILIIPQEIFWTDHAHHTKSGQISFKTF